MLDSNSVKKKIHNVCIIKINEKIANLESNLISIQEAKNNETKSSVGDKYETGRAMMQMEEDKIKIQLNQAKSIKNTLQNIKPDTEKSKVALGSLIITNQGNYYVSVALGKIELDEKTYFCISTKAPILQKLIGKQKGDKISFNGNSISIQDIY